MTVLTVIGGPRRKVDVVEEFFDDVSDRFGWKRLAQVLALFQILDEGRASYYLIGSRALGCHHKNSDLDVLCGGKAWGDFGRSRVALIEGWSEADNPFPSTLQVNYENVYGRVDEGWCLQDPSLSVDFQIMLDLKSRLGIWERVVADHLEDLRSFAALGKSQRLFKQKDLFRRLGDSDRYWPL